MGLFSCFAPPARTELQDPPSPATPTAEKPPTDEKPPLPPKARVAQHKPLVPTQPSHAFAGYAEAALASGREAMAKAAAQVAVDNYATTLAAPAATNKATRMAPKEPRVSDCGVTFKADQDKRASDTSGDRNSRQSDKSIDSKQSSMRLKVHLSKGPATSMRRSLIAQRQATRARSSRYAVGVLPAVSGRFSGSVDGEGDESSRLEPLGIYQSVMEDSDQLDAPRLSPANTAALNMHPLMRSMRWGNRSIMWAGSFARPDLTMRGSHEGNLSSYPSGMPRMPSMGRRGVGSPQASMMASRHSMRRLASGRANGEPRQPPQLTRVASSYYNALSDDARKVLSANGVKEDSHIHSHPAVAAFKNGTLGFGFSGGGFLFPYHLGVASRLVEMGLITPKTPLAGASSGSILVSLVGGGVSTARMMSEMATFTDDCRAHGTAGRFRKLIGDMITRSLPEDGWKRAAGTTHIAITHVFPYLQTHLITDFKSNEDLVAAVTTSCHLPAYSDGSFMVKYRNAFCIDGGAVQLVPLPPNATFAAGVSCIPLKHVSKLVPGAAKLDMVRRTSISMDMFGAFPFSWHQLATCILQPPADVVLSLMVERGKQDAASWADAVGLTQVLLAGKGMGPRTPTLTAFKSCAENNWPVPEDSEALPVAMAEAGLTIPEPETAPDAMPKTAEDPAGGISIWGLAAAEVAREEAEEGSTKHKADALAAGVTPAELEHDAPVPEIAISVKDGGQLLRSRWHGETATCAAEVGIMVAAGQKQSNVKLSLVVQGAEKGASARHVDLNLNIVCVA